MIFKKDEDGSEIVMFQGEQEEELYEMYVKFTEKTEEFDQKKRELQALDYEVKALRERLWSEALKSIPYDRKHKEDNSEVSWSVIRYTKDDGKKGVYLKENKQKGISIAGTHLPFPFLFNENDNNNNNDDS